MKIRLNANQGFTLIEIVVAMAVTFIVAAAIFATYRAYQMSHITQKELVSMNQNIRSAAYFITRDLRMAGFDPTTGAGATILVANEGSFQFQADLDRDGTIQNNEIFRYALTNDNNGDGVADSLPCHLGRDVGVVPNNTGLQIVAENIQAIDFEYMTYTPNTFLPMSMNAPLGGVDGVLVGPPLNMEEDIRFIRLTIVATSGDRTAVMAYKQTDSDQYWNALQTRLTLGSQNDTLRRSMLITEIHLRNM